MFENLSLPETENSQLMDDRLTVNLLKPCHRNF